PPLLHERLFLLTHASVALPRRQLSIQDFAHLPLILPSLPNTLRARVDHAFLTARLNSKLYAEASTSAILIPAVRDGAAATILPYSAAQPEVTSGLIKAHGLGLALSRELVLCARDRLLLSRAVGRGMEICQDEIRRVVKANARQGCKVLC